MIRKAKDVITMRDFDLARLLGGHGGDDITEWFSDNDIRLSEIAHHEDISGFSPYRRHNAG